MESIYKAYTEIIVGKILNVFLSFFLLTCLVVQSTIISLAQDSSNLELVALTKRLNLLLLALRFYKFAF